MKCFLIRLIRFYQKHISRRLPPSCRFTPTCSNYAIQAIELHGAFRGMCLTIWRILRCNPLCRGGYDPVPLPKNKKNIKPDNTRKEESDFDR